MKYEIDFDITSHCGSCGEEDENEGEEETEEEAEEKTEEDLDY